MLSVVTGSKCISFVMIGCHGNKIIYENVQADFCLYVNTFSLCSQVDVAAAFLKNKLLLYICWNIRYCLTPPQSRQIDFLQFFLHPLWWVGLFTKITCYLVYHSGTANKLGPFCFEKAHFTYTRGQPMILGLKGMFGLGKKACLWSLRERILHECVSSYQAISC